MRIGVHTGRILGGVVGTDVVRYDIYGEDVTIANLMESSGTVFEIIILGRESFGKWNYKKFNWEWVWRILIWICKRCLYPSKEINDGNLFCLSKWSRIISWRMN